MAELERLRNEISHLREEIRIKDARMPHIEAQKRPHYPRTERLAIVTIKNECTRRLILVPYRFAAMEQELAFYFSWYNGHRPHSRLGAVTLDEIFHHRSSGFTGWIRPALSLPCGAC